MTVTTSSDRYQPHHVTDRSYKAQVITEQTAPAAFELRELLTIDDLAGYLRVSKQSIYHWRKSGGGPVVHYLGKHLRFAKPGIGAWLYSRLTTRELAPG